MKKLRKALKKAHKELAKMAKDLPNEDAYAIPYSILVDAARDIARVLKDIGPAVKDAKAEHKLNPNQMPNRAIKWVGKP